MIQVKRNQKQLWNEVLGVIVKQKPLDYFEEHEKDHGRHSSWYVYVFDVVLTKVTEKWKNIRRFIHVHKCTIEKNKESHNDRFYISYCFETSAAHFHSGIRGHWTIENSLHWVKDVIHNEDHNQIVKDNGPVNSAIFSSIAINIQRTVGVRSVTENQMKFNTNIKRIFEHVRT